MSTRPYQNEFLDAVVSEHRADVSLQVGQMDTGLGKTVCAALLPDRFGLRPREQMLFLAHKDELVYQAAEKLAKYNPGRTVDIEKAEYQACPTSDIVVASVQTIGTMRDGKHNKRISKFDPGRFRVLVIDECHHATAAGYRNVLKYFGMTKEWRDPSKLLLGITATPNRADNIGLESVFQKLVFETQSSAREMIEAGYLADMRAWRIQTEADISKVGTRGGDFDLGQLGRVVCRTDRNELVVRKYIELGEGMPGICFTVSVEHAYEMAALFNMHGIRAAAVCGATPKKEREAALDLYERGVIRVLCGCDVFVEGVDKPMASVAIMTRPTKSPVWLQQALGRIRRPWPAPEDRDRHAGWRKPYGIVLDFVDNAGRHRLDLAPTIFGLPSYFDAKGASLAAVKKEIAEIQQKIPFGFDPSKYSSIEEIRAAAQRIDLFATPQVPAVAKRYSKYAWVEICDGVYRLPQPNGHESIEIRINALGHREIYTCRDGVACKRYVATNVADAFRAADEYVVPSTLVIRGAKWTKQCPKEGQCNFLFWKDPEIRRAYGSKEKFFAFAMGRYNSGDMGFARGAISSMIDRRLRSESATVSR